MSLLHNIIQDKECKGKMRQEGEKTRVEVERLRQRRFTAKSRPSPYCLNRSWRNEGRPRYILTPLRLRPYDS